VFALVATARHAEPMFETRDTSLATRAPGATATKPSLSFVGDAVCRLMTWFWDHRMFDAEFGASTFALSRIEAPIGGGDLRSAPEDPDVVLDGGHKQWRIALVRDDADVGNDTAVGLLHLDHLSELGRTVEFATTKDLSVWLEDADELCLRMGHPSHDASACLLHDAASPWRHLAQRLEDALDLHARNGAQLRLLSSASLRWPFRPDARVEP
jgi:hypothetical protein